MDWADEKAREWLKENRLSPRYNLAPLAALLREVRSHLTWFPRWCRDGHEQIGFRGDDELCPVCRRDAEWVKAVREVRKSQGGTHNNDWNGGVDIACDEILRRMSTEDK